MHSLLHVTQQILVATSKVKRNCSHACQQSPPLLCLSDPLYTHTPLALATACMTIEYILLDVFFSQVYIISQQSVHTASLVSFPP